MVLIFIQRVFIPNYKRMGSEVSFSDVCGSKMALASFILAKLVIREDTHAFLVEITYYQRVKNPSNDDDSSINTQYGRRFST